MHTQDASDREGHLIHSKMHTRMPAAIEIAVLEAEWTLLARSSHVVAQDAQIRVNQHFDRGHTRITQAAGTRGLSSVAVTVRGDVCWIGAGSSCIAWWAEVNEMHMEGASAVGDGSIGCATPMVYLGIQSVRQVSDWAVLVPSLPVPVSPVAGVLLPAVLSSCTSLYVAVRGIGGTGVRAHVHIVDSAPVASINKCHFPSSEAL